MQAAAEALDRKDDGSKERGSVFPCSFPQAQQLPMPGLGALLMSQIHHLKRGVRDDQPVAQATGSLIPIGSPVTRVGQATGPFICHAQILVFSHTRLQLHRVPPILSGLLVSWLASRSTAFASSHNLFARGPVFFFWGDDRCPASRLAPFLFEGPMEARHDLGFPIVTQAGRPHNYGGRVSAPFPWFLLRVLMPRLPDFFFSFLASPDWVPTDSRSRRFLAMLRHSPATLWPATTMHDSTSLEADGRVADGPKRLQTANSARRAGKRTTLHGA